MRASRIDRQAASPATTIIRVVQLHLCAEGQRGIAVPYRRDCQRTHRARDNARRAPDKPRRPMRARARRRPSCAAPLSRRSRVARRGLLSVRRLSTAADWVSGDGRFSPRSSRSFVRIRGKKGRSAPAEIDLRIDRDRTGDDARRAKNPPSGSLISLLAIGQCDVSDPPSFIFRASRQIAAFFAIFVRARARARLVVDRHGGRI